MEIGSPAIATYFSAIYHLLIGTLNSDAITGIISIVVAFVVFLIILAVMFTIFSYIFGWIERKMIARAHSRHGPTYVGKYGILQNLADVVKLLSKESIIPSNADKPLFQMMLPLLVAVFMTILVFIPFTSSFVGINTGLGLLVVFIALSFTPLLLFLAGWTSGNKFSSISAQRSVMILVSYEIPLILVVAAIAMMAGSFSLTSVVAAQQPWWYGLLMPIGFVVFFIVLLAELERPPFDLREADNELIAGWLTDVSAPYYGLALLLDYTRVFVGTLLISLLFLGGWLGPSFLPQIAWLMIKVVVLSLIIILVRATMVRMRIDKVLRTGWLYLTPLAVINLLITFLVFIR